MGVYLASASRSASLKDDLADDPRVLRLPLAAILFTEPVPEDPVSRSLVRHDPAKLADALLSLL